MRAIAGAIIFLAGIVLVSAVKLTKDLGSPIMPFYSYADDYVPGVAIAFCRSVSCGVGFLHGTAVPSR